DSAADQSPPQDRSAGRLRDRDCGSDSRGLDLSTPKPSAASYWGSDRLQCGLVTELLSVDMCKHLLHVVDEAISLTWLIDPFHDIRLIDPNGYVVQNCTVRDHRQDRLLKAPCGAQLGQDPTRVHRTRRQHRDDDIRILQLFSQLRLPVPTCTD